MLKRLAAASAILAVAFSAQSEVVVKDVTYKDGNTTLKGFIAYDDAKKAKRPGVIVVHEWWGITKHVRDSARELASMGYTALAVDMYGDGKTAEDPKTASELSGAVRKNPQAARSRFEAGKALLASHPTVDAKRIGAIGFCFGGSVVLEMARQGVGLAGVASFHGDLTTGNPAKPGTVKSKVLVLNGADDPFVKRESIEAFRKEMDAAKVSYRFVDYPGAVHAFTNPEATEKGKKYNLPLAYHAEADRQSKAEMRKFLAEVFR